MTCKTPFRVYSLRYFDFIKTSCLVFLMVLAGCIPDQDTGRSYRATKMFAPPPGSAGFQISNRAAKTDMLSLSAAPEAADGIDKDAGQEFSVVNTAATLPSSPSLQSDTTERAGSPELSPAGEPLPQLPIETALESFYQALRALEHGERKRPVTILHLGDDHVAADRFTSDLRRQFQARFGNAGRGFMVPGILRSEGVKIAKGGKWSVASSARNDPGAYGLTGVNVSSASRDAWLRLTSIAEPFDFAEVTFLAGPKAGSAAVSVDGQPKTVSTRSSSLAWKTLRLNRKGRELMVRARGDGPITLLSWAIGNERPGVRYVNLGLPGASALTAERWSPALVSADLKMLAPDLIVFSYGTNEAFKDDLDLGEYAARVERLLAVLKQAAPDASLLVIGPPDAARLPRFARASGAAADACRPLSRRERARYAALIKAADPRLGRWHPPVNLARVRASLARLAAKVQAFYWDWSEMMGGPCSIHAWVYQTPQLAAQNHVHLTAEGSRRSADALFLRLVYGYDSFKQLASKAAK